MAYNVGDVVVIARTEITDPEVGPGYIVSWTPPGGAEVVGIVESVDEHQIRFTVSRNNIAPVGE